MPPVALMLMVLMVVTPVFLVIRLELATRLPTSARQCSG